MRMWEVWTIMMAWFVILGGLAWLATDKPITGLIPTQTENEILEQEITDTGSIPLEVDGNLRALKVWAEVYGGGKAEVMIENADGERLYVYSTARKTGLSDITGLVDTQIKDPLIIDGGCADTCRLPGKFAKGPYRIVVKVSPGTTINLHRVSYETT